ncbi:MAG: HD domain-containing protein [candidate division Zixibacteria bacterium]|nr:HD domain-containing protein [candidate division Zixibacteria bacterium]
MFDTYSKETKDIEIELYELGKRFLNSLYSAINAASLYEVNNRNYTQRISNLREIMDKIFLRKSGFSITIDSGHFYISGIRLKPGKDSNLAVVYFSEKWTNFGISGLSFTNHIQSNELDHFLNLFATLNPNCSTPNENYRILIEKLDGLKIANIFPIRFLEYSEKLKHHDFSFKALAKKTYFKAISVLQETINITKEFENISITRTKRITQDIVDLIIGDEDAILELTALRDFDDYTFAHSVNVCILALTLGHKLGLDRTSLSDLGVGALLHDIGKVKLPKELVQSTSSFDEYDWLMMRKHPVHGVKVLLNSKPVDKGTAKAAAAIFEHHMELDGSGYPIIKNKREPLLFTRIVSIADYYDALVSGRVYHRKKYLPDEIIKNMINRTDKSFDSVLLKLFINAIGIFPVGSVVMLSSNELGIVANSNPDDIENPQVKIIANSEGAIKLEDVQVMNLTEFPEVYITKMIDAEIHSINIADYLDI